MKEKACKFSLAIPSDLYHEMEEFRMDSGGLNLSQACRCLIQRGLEEVKAEKNKEQNH